MSETATVDQTVIVGQLCQKARELGFRPVYVDGLYRKERCYGRVGVGDQFNVIELDYQMSEDLMLPVLIHEMAHILGDIGEKDYKWNTEPIVDAITHLALEEAGLGHLRDGYTKLGYLNRTLRYDIYDKFSDLIDGTLRKLQPMLQYTHGGDQVSTGSVSA